MSKGEIIMDQNVKVGEYVTVKVSTPITHVIFDYNRSKTSIRVIYEYSAVTDEPIMILKDRSRIWICTKINKSEDEFYFREFKFHSKIGKARFEKEFIIDLNFLENIDKEYKEFVLQAINKLK